MSPPRNCAANTRGRPFEPGNPGKPKGARHRATLAVEALLDGEAEALTRKAIEMALGGDMTALRLCLDRVAPARKGRTVVFDMPDVTAAADLVAALRAILRATADGTLTPDEAASFASLIEANRRAIETAEIEERLAALENR